MQYIAVHHVGVELRQGDELTAEEVIWRIADYHVSKESFPGIGYTFFVSREGYIYQCHELDSMTYGVASRNHEVLSICLEGSFMEHPPNAEQLASTTWLLSYLRELAPKAEVKGHRELALPDYPTACPGDAFDLATLL